MPGCSRMTYGLTGMCKSHSMNHRAQQLSDGVTPGGPGNKLTPDQVTELLRMWAALKSKTEIAQHFQITIKTVTKYLTKASSGRAS